MNARARFILCWLPLILSMGCGGGQQTTQSPAPRQTVILGIDAMDWQVVDPLLAAGKLPHLAALRDASVSGVNLSFVPLEKSPLIWASMATGLEPEHHGVGGFLRGRDGEEYDGLTSAADWRAPAIWDIAGAAGLRSCIIGWWVTFPAREIDGVLVSDHVSYTDQGNRNIEGMVRPAELAAELAALTVDYRDVPVEMLKVLVPRATEAQLNDLEDRRMQDLRILLAGDLTYLAIARELAQTEQFDLFSVYFRGLDLMCHKFWRFMDPADGPPAAAEEVDLFGEAVPGYLTLIDGWVGEMLTWFPEDANIMAVSDHGFYGPRRDRSGTMRKGAAEHRPEGAVMVRSLLYEPGVRFDKTFVMDITPTLLALMGLPPSQEMPGRVLRDGLTADAVKYVEHLEQHRIASYASLAPAPPPEVADDPALDAAVKKQLRSLGYVD